MISIERWTRLLLLGNICSSNKRITLLTTATQPFFPLDKTEKCMKNKLQLGVSILLACYTFFIDLVNNKYELVYEQMWNNNTEYHSLFDVAREQYPRTNSKNKSFDTFFIHLCTRSNLLLTKHNLNSIAAMKVLQAVKANFVSMGFNPELEQFNYILLKNIVMCASGTAAMWIFLLYEAESSQEFMESAYFVATCSGIGLSAISMIFLTTELFSFFDHFDEIANQSE